MANHHWKHKKSLLDYGRRFTWLLSQSCPYKHYHHRVQWLFEALFSFRPLFFSHSFGYFSTTIVLIFSMIISPSYYTFSPSLFQTQKRIFPFSHTEKTFEKSCFQRFSILLFIHWFLYLINDFLDRHSDSSWQEDRYLSQLPMLPTKQMLPKSTLLYLARLVLACLKRIDLGLQCLPLRERCLLK